jgi:large subunit ribosomal protein L17
MRHGVKKTKFHHGQDSHQALTRKLLLNFIQHGKIETTLKRAKVVKSNIDRLTSKSISAAESDKNVLLKVLGDRAAVKKMMLEIAPVFKGEVTGGFVRLERLGQRQGDNAEVARLTWTKEVVVKTEPVGGKPTKKEQKVSKVTQAK